MNWLRSRRRGTLTSSRYLISRLGDTARQVRFRADFRVRPQDTAFQFRTTPTAFRHTVLPRDRIRDLPVGDDAVVKNHTANDLGHFADNTVLPDDRPLDAGTLFDPRRASDHGVPGDLCFVVDERAVFGVGWENICGLRSG